MKSSGGCLAASMYNGWGRSPTGSSPSYFLCFVDLADAKDVPTGAGAVGIETSAGLTYFLNYDLKKSSVCTAFSMIKGWGRGPTASSPGYVGLVLRYGSVSIFLANSIALSFLAIASFNFDAVDWVDLACSTLALGYFSAWDLVFANSKTY